MAETTAPAPRAATPCALVGAATPTGAHWAALECAAHGPEAAYVSLAADDLDAAVANSFANHAFIVARAARIEAEGAARLASPYARTCTYDTGSALGNGPACDARTRYRVEYRPSCGGWHVSDVCGRHRDSTLGRVHPDQTRVVEIPRG